MFSQLFQKKRGTWKDDALAGLTTALALVPGSIAFAFVAGVPPISGLYAGFIVCLITAACGGRYRKIGKTLEVRHLSPDCARMLERAGDLVKATVAEDDPVYLVARIPVKAES